MKKWLQINRKVLIKASVFFVVILCLGAFINKKPVVSQDDKVFIQKFLKDWQMEADPLVPHSSFENEVLFLQKIQRKVVSDIKHKVISPEHFGVVNYYYTNRVGECYDRAVLLEKLMDYFNFKYRHVFIYYVRENGQLKVTEPGDFLKAKTNSHALLEVKTSRGWMVMDSNTDCLGLSKSNEPMTMSDFRYLLKNKKPIDLKYSPTVGDISFWVKYPNLKFVYGVYSRKGQFLKPRLPLPIPSVNFRMLLYNI
jgi:hypothetical protein